MLQNNPQFSLSKLTKNYVAMLRNFWEISINFWLLGWLQRNVWYIWKLYLSGVDNILLNLLSQFWLSQPWTHVSWKINPKIKTLLIESESLTIVYPTYMFIRSVEGLLSIKKQKSNPVFSSSFSRNFFVIPLYVNNE